MEAGRKWLHRFKSGHTVRAMPGIRHQSHTCATTTPQCCARPPCWQLVRSATPHWHRIGVRRRGTAARPSLTRSESSRAACCTSTARSQSPAASTPRKGIRVRSIGHPLWRALRKAMVLRQVASSLTALSRLTALPPAAPCHWHVRPERAAAATMTTAAALSEPASAPGPSPRAGEDAAPAAAPAPAVTPAAALDFALLLQKLKVRVPRAWRTWRLWPGGRRSGTCELCPLRPQTTKRTGWVRKGVDGPESIAGERCSTLVARWAEQQRAQAP